MSKQVIRSQVYYANLGEGIGSEQEGQRPVLILQNDIGNTYSPTTIVAAITSRQVKNMLPTHVSIRASAKNGLDENSVVLLEQIRTIDKSRLINCVGHLSTREMARIDKANRISLSV